MVELACIAEIRKNARETLRITLDQFKGYSLITLRVWERDRGGELRPTKSGVTCRVGLLPKISHAIGRALTEAEQRGLIIPGSEAIDASDYRPPPKRRNPALRAGSRITGLAAKPTTPDTTETETRSQEREQP
jgi:hypothetical protein